ncbi:MAG TPA: hypothetical protein GX719_05215 [Gammaproteobacteria bacterium]|nr:hypothetical protein [Gammaproteobacteria bacterium]
MLKVFSMVSNHLGRSALMLALTLGVGIVLYIAQVPAARPTLSLASVPPLAVGDWVFRAGKSTESHLIQTLSNSDFSHIGMVVSLQPEPLIVHASTDDDPQRSNQVLSSTLSDFIDPTLAYSFAIARPNFISEQEKQQAAKWLYKQLGQAFVLAERNTDHLYCTTLLVNALQHSAIPFQPEWQQIKAPLFSGEYLFPSAFANYPEIEWLYRSKHFK